MGSPHLQPHGPGIALLVGEAQPEHVDSSREHGGGWILEDFGCCGWVSWCGEGSHPPHTLRGNLNETA